MAELFRFDTGTVEAVPDDQAADALASQKYGLVNSLVKDGRVNMVDDRSGKTFSVPIEEAGSFLQNFRLQSGEEHRKGRVAQEYGSGLPSELAAAGLGAARGLSFGLSDQAAKATGFMTPEELAGYKEANPAASAVGEVGGVIGSLLIPGGAVGAAGKGVRGAAKVGGLAERAVLGAGREVGAQTFGQTLARAAAAKAAGGAVEGALYGAGHLVSEEALGNAEFTAEAVATHVGLGAIIGGGTAGALSLGGELGKAGLAKAAGAVESVVDGKSASEVITELSKDKALDAAGILGGARKKLRKTGRLDRAAESLLKVDHPDGGKIIKAGMSTAEVAPRIGDVIEHHGKSIGAFIENLDEAAVGIAKPVQRVNPRDVARRIREEVIEPIRDNPVNRSTVKQMSDFADEYGAKKGHWTFTEAQEQRRGWAKSWRSNRMTEAGDLLDAKRKVERIINDELESKAEKLGAQVLDPESFANYKRSKEIYADLIAVSDESADRAVALQGNRMVSLSDTISGAAGFAGSMGTGAGAAESALQGGAVSMVHKFVRERGSSVAAVMLDKASRLGAMQRMSMAVDKRISKGVSKLVSGYTSREGRSALPMASVAGILSTGVANRKGKPKSAGAAAIERVEELDRLAADPEQLTDRIASALSGVEGAAPNTSAQLGMLAAKSAQYLHSKAPKIAPSPNSLQPLMAKRDMSPAEISRFSRHVAAATDPLGVIDDLHRGTLTPEAVETLRELYPMIHEKLSAAIALGVAEMPTRLDYSDRVQLSLLLGRPVDDSMRPEYIAWAQDVWKQQPAEGRGGGGVRLTGLDGLDMSEDAMTPSQKLEAM